MPYIKENHRKHIRPHLDWVCGYAGNDVGILNYAITYLLLGAKPMRYADYNALIGVLECAKLELYRRQIAKYEEEKIVENGDVY